MSSYGAPFPSPVQWPQGHHRYIHSIHMLLRKGKKHTLLNTNLAVMANKSLAVVSFCAEVQVQMVRFFYVLGTTHFSRDLFTEDPRSCWREWRGGNIKSTGQHNGSCTRTLTLNRNIIDAQERQSLQAITNVVQSARERRLPASGSWAGGQRSVVRIVLGCMSGSCNRCCMFAGRF